jgi:hypothetical protein
MVRSQQQILTKSYKSNDKITISAGYNCAKLVYIALKIAPFDFMLFALFLYLTSEKRF